MKYKTYFERASRALGATPLLVPPRHLWGAPRTREPLQLEDVAVAEPAPRSPRSSPFPSRAEMAAQQPSARIIDVPSRTTKIAMPASSATESPEDPATPPVRRREPAPHSVVTSDAAVTKPVPIGAPQPGRAQSLPASPVDDPAGETEVEIHRGTATPQRRGAQERVAESDAMAVEPLAPRSVSRDAASGTPRRRRKGNAVASEEPSPSAEEVAVQIGSVEVIVERPPRAAAPPAPSHPLARGFVSAFGLRQG